VHIFRLDSETRAREQEEADGPQAARPSFAEESGAGVLSAVVGAVASTSTVEGAMGMMRSWTPKYFSVPRSFARFHMPDHDKCGKPLWDYRARCSRIVGPQIAFAPTRGDHLYVVHYNGFIYTASFDEAEGGEATLVSAVAWFSPRPDFVIRKDGGCAVTVSGEDEHAAEEGDTWELIS